MRKFLAAVSAAVFAVSATTAHGQETSGGYLGFAIGVIDYEEETFGLGLEDSATAYKALGGYSFSEHFALEAGWGGSSDLKSDVGSSTISAEYEVLTVRALGMIPLAKASLLGGVGYYDADLTTEDLSALFGSPRKSEDSGATVLGGVQFALPRLSIRAELEWFDTASNIQAWTGSVAVLFRF